MKQYRFPGFLVAASLCAFSPLLHSDTIDRGGDTQEVDVQALREWVNTKRQVTVKEIGGNLSISAEVRTEFQATGETCNGISQRGAGSFNPSTGTINPSRGYDIAVNLMMDYRADMTWSSFKLEFDNDAGIISGTNNKIKISRAYFGARVFSGDSYYSDIEVGRRKLGAIFDSKVEFNSYFDGVLAKYDQSFDRVGDFYVHLGTFIINENVDQYGYVGETGLMNIASSGFYAKYSLIDWDTKDFHADYVKQRVYDFLVSQATIGYKFYPASFKKQVTLYLAGLYNSKARRLDISDGKKANWGSYIGFSLGELKRKGDWALDANYQVLAAQCVPDFDVSGIGNGNVNDKLFYAEVKDKKPVKDKDGRLISTTKGTASSSGNYRGVCVTLDYLLTNNLNLQQQWNQSVTLDYGIGPWRSFKQYEIEFIYGF